MIFWVVYICILLIHLNILSPNFTQVLVVMRKKEGTKIKYVKFVISLHCSLCLLRFVTALNIMLNKYKDAFRYISVIHCKLIVTNFKEIYTIYIN